ncbi:hypothetical protein B4U79_16858, partial [Dinothrombium tinctorium]
GTIKKSYAVTSGAAWCLDFDDSLTYAAIGTEEGYVCIFRLGDGLLEDEVNFDRTLVKSESRILCIKWFKKQKTQLLITGSIGTIKFWNYDTRQCVEVIKVGSETTIVWCLYVLRDFVIVSGDSNGCTSFWDGNSATLLKSYKQHKADVLCLCESRTGGIFSSGVDPVIIEFKPTTNSRFVPGDPLHIHTHDVRALTLHPSGWLYSGGIDVYLIKSFYPPKTVVRYSPYFADNVHICEDLLMFQYNRTIEIWKLGSTEENDLAEKEGTRLSLANNAVKLLEFNAKKTIQKSAFSKEWIVYSTFEDLRFFTFSPNNIEKVPILFEPFSGTVDQMEICDTFLVLSTGLLVCVLQLDMSGIVSLYSKTMKSRVNKICSSAEQFAVKTADENVSVFTIKNGEMIATFRIDFSPLIMKFNMKNELWLASSDHRLLNYNIRKNRIEDCLRINEFDVFTPTRDIIFFNHYLIVHNENVVVFMNTNTKKKKTCLRYRHIIKLASIENRKNEFALVELTPEFIFKKLPDAFFRKKFGT